MTTEHEKQAAMKTARAKGTVGKNAIVPKVVREMAFKDETEILDYGCGAAQLHVKALRDEGYKVYGWDFSLPGLAANLVHTYDIIYMSNVLNVQSSIQMLSDTLNQVRNLVHKNWNCKLVVNYPNEPRKMGLNTKAMEMILNQYFNYVVRLPKEQVGNNVVFTCQWARYGA